MVTCVDIIYVATAEGWLYLAGVMDAYSKRIVGYAMADNMKTDLVLQALRSATTRRKPPPGLIHHKVRAKLKGSVGEAQGALSFALTCAFT